MKKQNSNPEPDPALIAAIDTPSQSALSLEQDPAPRNLETLEDGRVIDLETGEVVDVAIPDNLLTDGQARMNDGLADWVMSKMLRQESRLIAAQKAIDAAEAKAQELIQEALAKLEDMPEMIELRAIQRNAAKVVKKTQESLDFFHGCYDRQLGDWAAINLGTSKARTWATPFGQISLKKTPAALKIADEAKAISWAKVIIPEAVKTTEAFQISKVGKDMKAKLLADPAKALNAGLVIEPESEKVTVTTIAAN